jgi:serine O-acetyltransferase
MSRPRNPSKSDPVASSILRSYAADARMSRIDSGAGPNLDRATELLGLLRRLCFPGFFSSRELKASQVAPQLARLLKASRAALGELIGQSLSFQRRIGRLADPIDADRIVERFLEQTPAIRSVLSRDVQAAYDGDPAAVHTDETILCYPGVYAVFAHRVAHALHLLHVPLLPRLLSEIVHSQTGIDIHPGATIGHSFFIDHGTGVVIGETTLIGDRVKLYQGVTLGAMSFPKDEAGRLIRGSKRHPTLEDHVTVYANATILGGSTVVGRGCIIGGSVFLTRSVPPDHYVTMKSQELKYRAASMHDRLMKPTEGAGE